MSTLPTSGWRGTTHAVPQLLWIDAVFAASRGGRSIHSNSGAPLTSAMSAACSEEWPGCWRHCFTPWTGCSRPWVSADSTTCSPAESVRRYQWAQSGDMIHVDTKQLVRFERVGHRITGDRRLGSSRGTGYEKAHVAIDDATRLAYVEVLPDERQ